MRSGIGDGPRHPDRANLTCTVITGWTSRCCLVARRPCSRWPGTRRSSVAIGRPVRLVYVCRQRSRRRACHDRVQGQPAVPVSPISTSWKHGGGQVRSAGGGRAATTYDNVVLHPLPFADRADRQSCEGIFTNPLTAPLTQGCGVAREKCYDGAGGRKAWSGRKRRMRCRKARGAFGSRSPATSA